MNYTFILLSGGIGSRMNNMLPKQYMLLAGKPIIIHILEKVDVLDSISKIVIVCTDNYRAPIREMLDQYGICKQVEYATAGATRQASVLSGLKIADTENVIIHEAARPFVSIEDYQELIDEPCENTMIGIDIPFTVLKGYEKVEGLLTRSELVNVQLPQKYNKKALLEAHLKAEEEGCSFTEDASLIYYYNPDMKIKIIKGKDYNIKITSQIDLLTGEAIYDAYFKNY